MTLFMLFICLFVCFFIYVYFKNYNFDRLLNTFSCSQNIRPIVNNIFISIITTVNFFYGVKQYELK